MSVPSDMAPSAAPRRRYRRWIAGGLLAFLLMLLALSWIILRTGAGRDFILERVRSALPAGALYWERAEGSLTGGLTLHGVRYADAGVEVALDRVALDVDGGALAFGDLHVRSLVVHDGRVDLPPGEETSDAWPQQLRLPETLPALAFPVDVRVDRLDVARVDVFQAASPVIAVKQLQAAASLVDGVLSVDGLTLDSDRLAMALDAHLDSVRNWASRLATKAHVVLGDGEPLALDVDISGDLDDLQLKGRIGGGDVNQLQWHARGGLPNPRWTLSLDAPRLPESLVGTQALTLVLQGDGDLSAANFRGHFRQGDIAIDLADSRVAYEAGHVRVSPLALAMLGGRVEATGDVDLTADAPMFVLDLDWRDLTLPAEAGTDSVVTHGQAQMRGPLSDYAVTLDGHFVRAGQEAHLDLDGRGSTEALDIVRLDARLPTGSLNAKGQVVWAPDFSARLDVALDHFDPSYFVADLPGSISARLSIDGGWGEHGPYGQLQMPRVSGQLRERALQGNAQFQATRDGKGEGRVTLQVGDSHLQGEGRWGAQWDVSARLSPLRLPDVLPQAQGVVQGSVTLRGVRDAPSLSVQLDGREVAVADQSARALAVRIGLQAWTRGNVSLEAQGLTLGGQSFDNLSLTGDGEREHHEVQATLAGPDLETSLDLAGGLDRDGLWRGTLKQLGIVPAGRTPWRLQTPAVISYHSRNGVATLTETCLEAPPASLCAQIQSRGGASEGAVRLEDFDLSELDALLAGILDHPVSVQGTLAAHAQFRRAADGQLHADAEVEVPSVGLRLDPASPRQLLDLRGLKATVALDPAQARLQLNSDDSGTGHLRVQVTLDTPMAPDGALSGTADVLLPDLVALELFTDQVVDPKGRMQGHLVLAGSRRAPRLDGRLEVDDFSAELPAMGISPRQGRFLMESHDSRRARVNGTVMLGDGTLAVEGDLDLAAAGGAAGTFTLKGDALTVMDVPEARVKAAPDLTLQLAGSSLKVRGAVTVPYARIDLERLQSVTAPSSDVVIVDETQVKGGLAVDTDVSVTLGEDVRMNGYGLKGTLAGQLRVRDRPGRATTARGAIDVGGAYKAYGQDLSITRGHVSWSATPIDTPALDIRAERKIDAITVGVQVRGTALVPELSLWSDPAMEQAEQLSYLVLGRPLRSASQADGTQLTQAAAAMGGNLLAQKLGARLGLEEVGVADNRALGGAALTVGMHLSPRLYVSYGVALFGSGQVITFKYLLSRLWNIQIDSGTENRAALNFRLER